MGCFFQQNSVGGNFLVDNTFCFKCRYNTFPGGVTAEICMVHDKFSRLIVNGMRNIGSGSYGSSCITGGRRNVNIAKGSVASDFPVCNTVKRNTSSKAQIILMRDHVQMI